MAFLLILRENAKNSEFRQWFSNYTRIVAITVCASGADINVMSVLKSGYGGLKSFDSPFSHGAEKWIFWSSCANLLTEDIPQFIIQVFK